MPGRLTANIAFIGNRNGCEIALIGDNKQERCDDELCRGFCSEIYPNQNI